VTTGNSVSASAASMAARFGGTMSKIP